MKIKIFLFALAIAASVSIFTTSVDAQARVVVKFPRGSHSATVKGSIRGYRYIDYVLGGRAGQNMTVELDSTNNKAQLVVLDPNKENVDNGTGVGEYSGELLQSGNYTVRVLMSRAEARRKGAATSFVATFTIQ